MKTQMRMIDESILYSSAPVIVWEGDLDTTSLHIGAPISLKGGKTVFVNMFGLSLLDDEPVKIIYVKVNPKTI